MNVTGRRTDGRVSDRSPGRRRARIEAAGEPVAVDGRGELLVAALVVAVADERRERVSDTSYGAQVTAPALSLSVRVSAKPGAAAVMVAVPAPWWVSVKAGAVSVAGRVTVPVGAAAVDELRAGDRVGDVLDATPPGRSRTGRPSRRTCRRPAGARSPVAERGEGHVDVRGQAAPRRPPGASSRRLLLPEVRVGRSPSSGATAMVTGRSTPRRRASIVEHHGARRPARRGSAWSEPGRRAAGRGEGRRRRRRARAHGARVARRQPGQVAGDGSSRRSRAGPDSSSVRPGRRRAAPRRAWRRASRSTRCSRRPGRGSRSAGRPGAGPG